MRTTIVSAGSNAKGQLSQGSQIDSHVLRECSFCFPDSSKVIDIAAGANHTLLLLKSTGTSLGRHELWGSGDGSKGQLGERFQREHGRSSTFKRLELEISLDDGWDIKSIASAWETSYVVLSHESEGDVLLSMGANHFGELGNGGPSTQNSEPDLNNATHIITFDHLFTQMSGRAILRILKVKAGPHHAVANIVACISAGHEQEIVAGWGAARHGQLASTSTSVIPSPALLPISSAADFALGIQHSVFLHASGTVCGLGSGRKHQLDGIKSLAGVQNVAATWNGTYLVVQQEKKWAIFATGSNSKGQLAGPPSESRTNNPPGPVEISVPSELMNSDSQLLAIACGSEHVLIVTRKPIPVSDGSIGIENEWTTEVWGWGWNEHGNLGLGHTEDVCSVTKIWPPNRSAVSRQCQRVSNVWAGCGTTWIVLEEDC